MRKIISKFQCQSVMPAGGGYPTVARLSAVYANSDGTENEENKSFSDATPNGHIELSINAEVKAHKYFTNGRYYYVTFELIPMTEVELVMDKISKLPQEEQSDAWSDYYKAQALKEE